MPKRRLAMGELEARVMQVLWARRDPMTPGNVHAVLATERDLAYTTVMTILVRLWQKGLVDRQRVGRAYAYHPVRTRAEHAAGRMREVLESAGDKTEVLTRFLSSIPASDRAQLRRLLGRTSRKVK